MATIDSLVARMVPFLRDNYNSTFTSAVMQDAVKAAIRKTWPSFFTVSRTSLGTFAVGTESVSFASALTAGVPYSLVNIEYQTSRGPMGLRGRAVGTDYLIAPLERERTLFAVVASGYPVPATTSATLTTPAEIDDLLIDLACAWLFEGYLGGRISYDKYTTVTSDDANGSYDVDMAMRRFAESAERRVAELGSPLPSARVR